MKNDNYNDNYYNYNDQEYDTRSPGPGPYTPGPGPYRPPPNRQNTDTLNILTWVIDIGLIFVCFPIGLLLTICKAGGLDIVGTILRAVTGQSQSSRNRQSTRQNSTSYTYHRTQTGSSRQATYTQASYSRQEHQKTTGSTQTTQARKSPKNEDTDGIQHADTGNKPKKIFGWILAVFGVIMLIDAAADMTSVWNLLTSIAITVGGGALLFSARASRKKEAQFRRIVAAAGSAGIVSIARITNTLGLKDTEGEKLLTEMIDRGFFGSRAYIDHARGLLVIRPEDMRDVYRKEDEAKATQEKEAQQASRTEYEQYVERLRHADEEIEDEVMSKKIRRMQALTESIFAEVETRPEKKPQIDRFMNYYLPTTLKLLDSYARIEAQGVSGTNMAKAKSDIEGIADTLVAGFEKQLDKLYSAEAMDIAGEVSVIENMLRRDGLSGDNGFGQTTGGH